jgi:N-acyl-L-homoserine lactone synthetase
MSYIVAGRLDDLPSDIRHHLGTFRHKVFVQRLHWEIPGVSHDTTSEWDKFDGDATVHLVALSADYEVCGCARLMPTTGPYLLRDVFPELAGPGSLPSLPSIWEMSRFAGSGLPEHRAGSTSGMSLFPYAMALALSFGASVPTLRARSARYRRWHGAGLRQYRCVLNRSGPCRVPQTSVRSCHAAELDHPLRTAPTRRTWHTGSFASN